jgi:hypothetical protein
VFVDVGKDLRVYTWAEKTQPVAKPGDVEFNFGE